MNSTRLLRHLSLLAIVFSFTLATLSAGNAVAQKPQVPTGIMSRDVVAPYVPPSVFYRGQIAPTQARNSAGYKFADGKLFVTTLVDTSGYSSAVQQTYQGYLILEVPLSFGGKTLRPGAYGFGFVEGNRMVVMDLGSNEVLSTSTTSDAGLARPNPLQILTDPASASSFRLYLGRNYVTVTPASK
jgi:hypothetical protein